jgi:hypothetical protein
MIIVNMHPIARRAMICDVRFAMCDLRFATVFAD